MSHALDVQNKRGGRVKLLSLTSPETEYNHAEKGDALYAMELTLSLEVCRDNHEPCKVCPMVSLCSALGCFSVDRSRDGDEVEKLGASSASSLCDGRANCVRRS